MITAKEMEQGLCTEGDGQHCSCWWDCEPCCRCGFDGGGDDCDCPRHTAQRESR